MTTAQLLELGTGDYASVISASRDAGGLPLLSPGAGSTRHSLLPRFHTFDGESTSDAFEIWDPRDEFPCGVYLRLPNKKSRIVGDNGLGLQHPPAIPVVDVLCIVEGPYDVLEERDICTFGTFHAGVLRSLSPNAIILCPDGDIWQDPGLFAGFLQVLTWLLQPGGGVRPYLVAVEHIPDGKDPDECPQDLRRWIARKNLPQYMKERMRDVTGTSPRG
jgi:hypothetical protein